MVTFPILYGQIKMLSISCFVVKRTDLRKKITHIRLINCLEWQKCQQMLSATLQSMIVIPGEHWRYDDEDGGVGNVGVVLDVLESGMTLV